MCVGECLCQVPGTSVAVSSDNRPVNCQGLSSPLLPGKGSEKQLLSAGTHRSAHMKYTHAHTGRQRQVLKERERLKYRDGDPRKDNQKKASRPDKRHHADLAL